MKNRTGNLIFSILFCVDKVKIAQLLLTHGANVDARDVHGCTALMRSGEQGKNVEIFEEIL